MTVILEGPDATGKSTLAVYLSHTLEWPIQSSEGPEKYEGEITERIKRYNQLPRKIIFDRHPCVSQPIYSPYRNGERISHTLLDDFYALKPFFIYCRAKIGKHYYHQLKNHDTAEHIQVLNNHSKEIEKAYDLWALENAHMIYHIGDDMWPIANAIIGAR